MSRSFDAIIVGAGQAGPPLAARLTAAGMSVALVERKLVGGTCVNTGCTPTKALVASAHAAHMARRAAEYGVRIEGPVRVDMKAAKARADQIARSSREGLEGMLASLPRFTLFRGHALFESARELRVGSQIISAERIVLNTGGRAAVPPIPGLERVPYLTNSSLLALEELPRHLVIVGGSYVGLEFAQIFRRFGSEVTVVEKGPQLMKREDPDVAESVRGILEKEGIAQRLSAECIQLGGGGTEISVGLDCLEGERQVVGSHLLMAVGRRPNTDDLGLDRAGIATDARGYITVDDHLQTNIPGIWALGDCNGKGAFTHTAYNDYEVLAANWLGDGTRKVSDRITAYALYTDPPLGRAGMTELEARKTGKRVLVGRRPMTRVGRAIEKGETQGFMKIMVDGESRRILGASILGTGGDEAIHCVLDTMYANAPYETLQRAMHIHPTVAELIPTVLGDLQPI
jgi:pyruvate/2-oxoglutarate dehydrogenase complex dihydrolipoamide dehydrogenase (E3) component